MSTEVASERSVQHVRANGIDIAYVEAGSGPPLVLLHGALVSTGPAWAGSRVAYVDHVATLAKHFRVIAPDTRGSGATVHPGGPATFDVLTQDVVALIEALDLGRALLAGFSEGGGTATLVALERPDLVAAVVNHAGFDYFDLDVWRKTVESQLRPIFGGRPGATQADPDAAERIVQAIPPMAPTFATMKADYAAAQGPGHWRTYLRQFFDRSSRPVGYGLADLGRITSPMLLLTGDRDGFCSVETACAAYRALGAGELAVVPNLGHEITPRAVEVMTDFLLRHAGG